VCGLWALGRGTGSSVPNRAQVEEGEGADGWAPPVGERKREGKWAERKRKKKEREEEKSGPSEGKRGGEAGLAGEMVAGGPVRERKERKEKKRKRDFYAQKTK
jgi:hypothetical protein